MKISIKEFDGIRMIVVDNEVFDWGVDKEALRRAQIASKNDPSIRNHFLGNIQKHFVDSFSEFIGRKISLSEINQALETGQL